jgi:hypothetical protein
VKTKGGQELEPIELEDDRPPSILAGQEMVIAFIIPPPEVPRFLALQHKEIDSAIVNARVVEFGKRRTME